MSFAFIDLKNKKSYGLCLGYYLDTFPHIPLSNSYSKHFHFKIIYFTLFVHNVRLQIIFKTLR